MSGNKNRIMFTVGAILTYVKCHVRILPDTHFFLCPALYKTVYVGHYIAKKSLSGYLLDTSLH